MNVRALLRPARRLWPQKVRTRLTVIYAALFFAAGTALLGLTYGVVASNLPTRPPVSLTTNTAEVNRWERECESAGPAFNGTGHPVPLSPAALLTGCKQAYSDYMAGTAAGMQEQRQQTLYKLLRFWFVGLAAMTVASGGLG